MQRVKYRTQCESLVRIFLQAFFHRRQQSKLTMIGRDARQACLHWTDFRYSYIHTCWPYCKFNIYRKSWIDKGAMWHLCTKRFLTWFSDTTDWDKRRKAALCPSKIRISHEASRKCASINSYVYVRRSKMNVPLIIFGIFYFLTVFRLSHAWDNDDLEVFDVVEEVNQNFYEVLGVTQVLFCDLNVYVLERMHDFHI